MNAASITLTHDRNRDLLFAEAVQRVEEGAEPEAIATLLRAIRANPRVLLTPEQFTAFSRGLAQVPRRADFPYVEPSDLTGIATERAASSPSTGAATDLSSRLLGAWVGRAAGCMLGKPFEGYGYAHLRRYLELHQAYPLEAYIPAPRSAEEERMLHWSWPQTVAGALSHAVRDDDLDYPILALAILERHGRDFTPAQVGQTWLETLPYGIVYTAERQAYRNLVEGQSPPTSAARYNPYREWIGAQIRADVWGYVNPGNPRAAAEMAWRDASLTHVKNGIYGEMFFAALLAAVLGGASLDQALAAGLGELPARSRFAAMAQQVQAWASEGTGWEDTRQKIEDTYGSYHWIHTLNNAALVIAALLHGQTDFTRTIGLAVAGGWDTDCNGATAGSIIGALHGIEAIPSSWRQPLGDRVESYVAGQASTSLTELAFRTEALAERQ